jgi:hypothetical protein
MKIKPVLDNLNFRFIYNTSVHGNSLGEVKAFLEQQSNTYNDLVYAHNEKPIMAEHYPPNTPETDRIYDLVIYTSWYGFWRIFKAFKTIRAIRRSAQENLTLLTGCGYIGIMFAMDEAAQVDELLGL